MKVGLQIHNRTHVLGLRSRRYLKQKPWILVASAFQKNIAP